ncbi:hypothetical protein HPB51_023090 [Rhipicephalus microplus]|uniref:Uncharacterized protein n=1 Tax=Rhipicephalus microplus TaxID=6941 RepID=A0A9J6DJ08_RHIMP|nr:hypothetical protein HPB51_023090 [Rhipicephalus microplus]
MQTLETFSPSPKVRDNGSAPLQPPPPLPADHSYHEYTHTTTPFRRAPISDKRAAAAVAVGHIGQPRERPRRLSLRAAIADHSGSWAWSTGAFPGSSCCHQTSVPSTLFPQPTSPPVSFTCLPSSSRKNQERLRHGRTVSDADSAAAALCHPRTDGPPGRTEPGRAV